MSELRLSVQDAVEQLLMSQSTIYTWIEKGFLQVEETPAGRVIVISEEELEEIRARNLKSKRNKVSKQIKVKNITDGNGNVVDAEVFNDDDEMKNSLGTMNSDMIKYISELAAKAGKFDLLEDIQKQKQEDVEFWRNEYFKLNTQNSTLQVENANLIKENAELKEQIRKLKRPFGRFFN